MTSLFSNLFVFFLLCSISTFAQEFKPQLNHKIDFEEFSGEPLANKYGNVSSIKVVYELRTQKLHFINSHNYKNHLQFCQKQLGYIDGAGNFLTRNYSNTSKRKYLLANINYFHSTNTYVLDLSPVDEMEEKYIVQMYNLVAKNTYVGKNLIFLINSPRLQKIDSSLSTQIPTILPSEIYGQQTFQAVSKYSNVGKLRIVENVKELKTPLLPTDIIVLKKIPNYLPGVAGIIVTEFQTPLSHISILGLNRKIPICAYTNAFDNNKIESFEGKQVKFEVLADTFLLSLDTSNIHLQRTKSITLTCDLTVDSLLLVNEITQHYSNCVGSKAANFGELHKISQKADFRIPEGGMAIPFYFYKEHITGSKAEKYINQLLSAPPTNPEDLQKQLERIQKYILKKNVNPTLIAEIEAELRKTEYKKFRFRSSTNAEDIDGFSGAGLYTSKTGILDNKKKSIELAIKKVWASLWTYNAYVERDYFNINQKEVVMGILVHRAFPKEKVNGVAITKNIYRKESRGFVVNAQLGNENVVKPSPGVTCDQFICFPADANKIYKEKIVIDVITYSSLNDGNLVMTEEEIQHLANQLEIIKRYLSPNISARNYPKIGYDVEFKLNGKNRNLYIKQVRPYND